MDYIKKKLCLVTNAGLRTVGTKTGKLMHRDALPARHYWSVPPPPDKIAWDILRALIHVNVAYHLAVWSILLCAIAERDDPSVVTCHWMSTKAFLYLFTLFIHNCGVSSRPIFPGK